MSYLQILSFLEIEFPLNQQLLLELLVDSLHHYCFRGVLLGSGLRFDYLLVRHLSTLLRKPIWSHPSQGALDS